MVSNEELKEISEKEKDRLVAYLDILGFREHVKKFINPKQEADAQILDIINAALNDALKIIKSYDNILITYRNFSDCFCLSIPAHHNKYTEATMLSLFITTLNHFNFHLIRNDIYLRGGLSFGFHSEEKDIIFSEGLIKAYDLESGKAVYPRILIDEGLVERLEKLWINDKGVLLDFGIEKKIITEWDGTTFINPFNLMKSMGRDTLKIQRKRFKTQRAFNSMIKQTDKAFHNDIKGNLERKIIEQEKNEYILQKYLWLNELLKWNINRKRSKIKFEYLLKS